MKKVYIVCISNIIDSDRGIFDNPEEAVKLANELVRDGEKKYTETNTDERHVEIMVYNYDEEYDEYDYIEDYEW